MVRRIEFEKVSDLPVFSDDFSLASCSVSGAGAGLFLFVENSAKGQVRKTFKQGIGFFPKTRMGALKRFALLEMSDNRCRAFELGELDLTFPLVDVFPDGRVLVAASRSQWRGRDDYDKNGVVVDPSTGKQSHILLGDGIESLSIDTLGRIWVSYFDEGIFGNFGWGYIDPSPAPVGASGLNCFSAGGDILWNFPSDDECGGISDCDAMNVHGQTAWVHFYPEFPLCRVSSDFQRRYWKTGLSGCGHFAVNDPSVLFSGQYEDAPAIGHLAILGDGKLEGYQEVEFGLPDGSPISSGQLLGRGADMHYFDESGWYRTRLVDGDC